MPVVMFSAKCSRNDCSSPIAQAERSQRSSCSGAGLPNRLEGVLRKITARFTPITSRSNSRNSRSSACGSRECVNNPENFRKASSALKCTGPLPCAHNSDDGGPPGVSGRVFAGSHLEYPIQQMARGALLRTGLVITWETPSKKASSSPSQCVVRAGHDQRRLRRRLAHLHRSNAWRARRSVPGRGSLRLWLPAPAATQPRAGPPSR